MPFTIRALDRTADRRGVEAIDTSFETATVFDVVTRARGIELVERAVDPPHVKRYSIGEVFAPWASWDTGWVAVDDADGAIRGFAVCGYDPRQDEQHRGPAQIADMFSVYARTAVPS